MEPTKCSCELNLKGNEIGIKLSIRKRGGIKHYTAKGKIKDTEYFLASIVKTFAKLFGMGDIDVVRYQSEEEAKAENPLNDIIGLSEKGRLERWKG